MSSIVVSFSLCLFALFLSPLPFFLSALSSCRE
jgi:hypothetical protein